MAILMAIPAAGAANPYPDGGGRFDGGAEGWQVTEASCNVPVLCSASGGYDGGDGTPAGSLAAETEIGLNLVSLFHSTVTMQSPDFVAAGGGAATLHLERRFAPGSLVDLAPQLTYTAQLVDRTSGKRTTSISESLDGASGWSGEDGAAVVQAGHTYAILITARTSSTVAGTGLLSGATAARFDNVALTVGADGSAGGGSGSGGSAGGGITAARLADLAPGTVAGPAQLKGKRLLVKARCPRRIGHACRIAVRGLLSKRKPATAQQRVKVATGKTRRLVLRVKPRAKGSLAGRKRLLFRIRVRAGGVEATTLKRLRLIRR
ncbi:MAG TPA: hypothetical protein VLK37_07260 [Solirubrobacterales bacterium]|nr:hypothetical protein [Solirubrobacterales bacterium]